MRFLSFFFFMGGLASCAVSSGDYYIGIRGDGVRRSPSDSTKKFFNFNDAKFAWNGGTLFTGVMYSGLGMAISGRVFLGYRPQNADQPVTTDTETKKITLLNRWDGGAEILLGKKLAIFTLYGLGGVQTSPLQIRGYRTVKGEQREVFYYGGKGEPQIDDVKFPKQKSPRNWLFNFSLGGGVQVDLGQKMFVCAEIRHIFAHEKDLTANVSHAVDGKVESFAQKITQPFKRGDTRFSVGLGLHL